MRVISVRNVHSALPEVLQQLGKHGVDRDSRNGPVTRFPSPTTIHYRNPRERVLFHEDRDANPFFHLYESLWMLSGRKDVASVAHYVKRMETFSDDGKNFHAAYGHRWFKHFGLDQPGMIIEALHKNPDDRRCVLQMWDSRADLGQSGKDFPCNTQAFFEIGVDGRLNMTVLNRSNDIVWGALGANAVHFSILQEYIACALDVPVGEYWQVSNNLHAYHDTLKQVENLPLQSSNWSSPYATGHVHPFPLMCVDLKTWREDLAIFMEKGPIVGFRDPFFTAVVTPMHYAHAAFKKKDFEAALEIIEQCKATDWKLAAKEWLLRRQHNHNVKKANGK